MTASDARNVRPHNRDWLHAWIENYTGIRLARQPVCLGHQAPFDPVADGFLDRANHPATLVLGSRGSGKSLGIGIGLHLDCRFHRGHEARILGGSREQSRQIYNALERYVHRGRGDMGSDGGPDVIRSLLKESVAYTNGSSASLLAASMKSARGPHVPSVLLDEIDEIKEEIREAAVGMILGDPDDRRSSRRKSTHDQLPGVVRMGSTGHKPDGPMAKLVKTATESDDPNRPKLYTYCVFEVLERCPSSRSGPNLERCPECPIVAYCHEDRIATGDLTRPPKAKISNGHYPLKGLIRNVSLVSKRMFQADYLSKGAKVDGLWFPNFDEAKHVTGDAEYDPNLPVHLAVDIGNRTGAVWCQILPLARDAYRLSVFADFYSDNAPSAEVVARSIIRISETHCNGRVDYAVADPAGNSKTAVGPSVLAEYQRAGLKLRGWPIHKVVDSLALLESFVEDASGATTLRIHPRCKHLITAFKTYRRGGKAPQWSDLPADPQHPAEDLIDALRGGLQAKFPNGRQPQRTGSTRRTSDILF